MAREPFAFLLGLGRKPYLWAMRIIDLSHTISTDTLTYQGLPKPIICDFMSREASQEHYEAGTSFQIGRIDMVVNSGTYIDVPFHRYADGQDLSVMPIQHFVGLPGVKVNHFFEQNDLEIGREVFEDIDVKGKAVLIYTGWDRFWQTEQYFKPHPYLNEQAALYLREEGAVLVGTDAKNLDDTRGKARPAHTILLKENILIVEHLNGLDRLPGEGFYFSAIPPKFEGLGSFPVRAFAEI
ncbi:MAG: cyclase family protein [Bacteroidota bacterium]